MSNITPARFESGQPMLLAGLRRHHTFQGAEASIAEQWNAFNALGEIPGRTGEKRFGVMCGSGPTGFEYMCAVEVESFEGLPEGLGRMRVPPQQYAVFSPAPNASLRETWMGIFQWLSGGSHDSAHLPDFEVYGAESDPLGAIDGIEVWVGVVPRQAPVLE